MATCLRSFTNIFHPQMCAMKNRLRFCYQLNTITVKFQSSSSFLEKFLEKGDENEIINEGHIHQSQDDLNRINQLLSHSKISENLYQYTLKNTERIKILPYSRSQLVDIFPRRQSTHDWNLHSFDPVYFALKPVPPTPDEIHEVKLDTLIEDDIICKTNCLIAMIPTTDPIFNELIDNEFHYSPLTDFEKQMINMASDSSVTMNGIDQTTLNSRPTNTQLECIYNKMSQMLPKFFTHPHDYSMYHPDIIFNNNIRGISTKGLSAYVQQITLVRIVGHLKFAHVRFEVLKITKHPDDSTVRVRWRIRGVSGMKFLKNLFKISLFDWKKLLNEESDWYDGFSTFYVGEDGKIYRHDCDKMMPDEEKTPAVSNKGLAAKLACVVGVVQRPVLDDLAVILTSLLKPGDINPKPTLGK